jgi:putative ABC transport system substrate-binding protein
MLLSRHTKMRRRQFIAGLGGAAAWPLAARAQQPKVPVVGFLSSGSAVPETPPPAFRQALNERGYFEGRNVVFGFRWAGDQYDRLPDLARDLVQRRVDVIVTLGNINTALAAKAATSTIPIVFAMGSDPVEFGVVSNLARPGGNVSGVTVLNRELMAKRLEILRELLPNETVVGLLANPSNLNTDLVVRELREVSQSKGSALHGVAVSTKSNLDTAIANLVQAGAGSFMYALDSLFASSLDQLTALASHYRIPAIYHQRAAVEKGGLMSYGSGRLAAESPLVGEYTVRILKGERPGDLRPTGDNGRLRDQPQDRQGSRPNHSAYAVRPCRRAGRVIGLFPAVHGPSLATRDVRLEFAKGGNADIDQIAVANCDFMGA